MHENAAEAGIPFDAPPFVRRVSAVLDGGRRISGIAWGEGQPQILLLHGGGQNAHTWDTVAIALKQSLLALDLPGHGHSADRRSGGVEWIAAAAIDIAAAAATLAPYARTVVGMSAGGLVGIALAAQSPARVARLMLVDILPAPRPEATRPIREFLDGPDSFPTLEAMIERAATYNPSRTPSSLRRGVIHNAVQRGDGRWQWRHQRGTISTSTGRRTAAAATHENLWKTLGTTRAALALVRGMAKGSVVDDDQERRLRALRPDAQVTHIGAAGHSVQGDRPCDLAKAISHFAAVSHVDEAIDIGPATE